LYSQSRAAAHWKTSKGEVKMNFLLSLIAGAIVGYLASRIMQTDLRQGLVQDIAVGAIGAFLASYFLSPVLRAGNINDAITLTTLLVTLLGAVFMLALYKMIARRS
jgi:uncharacterized membrane protein YeaQ/YmgE (transglycosylase-associated protein family)